MDSKILNGRTLIIGLDPAGAYYKEEINGAIQYRGALFSFMNTWSSIFNCSYRVIECQDYEHCRRGHPLGVKINETWGGLISFLVGGEADIVAFDWAYVSERDESADFLESWYETELNILVPVDNKAQVQHRLSLDQYGFKKFWKTWTIMTIYSLILLILRYLLGPKAGNLNLRLADTTCVLCYRKFIAQSKYDLKQILPPIQCKPGAMFWWYITILMRNAFLATLVASILVPPVVDRVESLFDLHYNHPDIPLMVSRGGTPSSIFNPSSPVELFREVSPHLLRGSVADMRNVAANEFIAIASIYDFLSRLLSSNCHREFYILPEAFMRIGASSLVAEKSPLKRVLDRAIVSSREVGFTLFWRQTLLRVKSHLAARACMSSKNADSGVENKLIFLKYLAKFKDNQLRFAHFLQIARVLGILMGASLGLWLGSWGKAVYDKRKLSRIHSTLDSKIVTGGESEYKPVPSPESESDLRVNKEIFPVEAVTSVEPRKVGVMMISLGSTYRRKSYIA